MNMVPVGLIAEEDLARRFPQRRGEVLRHALRVRERQKALFHEARKLLTWHPIHTTKTVLVTGALSFTIALLASYVVSIGHWYAAAKDLSFTVPIPFLADRAIDLGASVPSSTSLALAARLPAYGLKESFAIAVLGMAIVLIEKLVTSLFHWRKARMLREAEADLVSEMKVLHDWLRDG